MEPIVDINTKSTTDVNNTSTQTQDLGNKISSLGIIAQEYEDSDSEIKGTHTVDIEKPENTIKNSEIVETQVDIQVEIQVNAKVDTKIDVQNMHQHRSKDRVSSSDSSDSESDSSSSNSNNSSDSDDDSDNNHKNREKKKKKTIVFKEIPVQSELDGLPPVEDLKISVPEVICDSFGEITGIVEELAVIKSRPNKPALREESILFIDRGQRALGKIFDVFGPVKEPHYTVRFNSVQHLQEKGIKVGMQVYYCPNSKYTFLVFLSEVMKMKPSDSNCDDSDCEHPDFSDDEEEKRYYDKLHKQRKYSTKTVQNRNKNSGDDTQSKRICTLKTSHTLTNSTSSTSTSKASTSSTSTSKASTPSTSTSESTFYRRNSRNINYSSQALYPRGPAWKNSNQFNCTSQFNQYRPSQDNSRNACFMYNTLPPSYQERYAAPPFLSPTLPQHYTNYNSYNSNYEHQYYPSTDMSTQYSYVPQYSHPSYGGYPTFNSPFYDSNHSVEFSHSNPQYPQSYWSPISLPPPPPPSSASPLSSSPPPNNFTNK
ncbi:H/ACA ribonucleoprotein complex non-core subunit NAF1 [Odontomachus brunneus]|uniref:H/ACA ribonucleoprotein complex non-core subunit NAF1 n=1 Tax=Odontomachus brunneus TaxID=486640 RepID=UPI0013F26A85|nr:H/ACA ribonucleoprotein complex non-core subunit NAF1 [Odontomachus brunneus]